MLIHRTVNNLARQVFKSSRECTVCVNDNVVMVILMCSDLCMFILIHRKSQQSRRAGVYVSLCMHHVGVGDKCSHGHSYLCKFMCVYVNLQKSQQSTGVGVQVSPSVHSAGVGDSGIKVTETAVGGYGAEQSDSENSDVNEEDQDVEESIRDVEELTQVGV